MASGQRKPLYERTSSLSFSLNTSTTTRNGTQQEGPEPKQQQQLYSPFIPNGTGSDITKKMFEYDRLALDVAEQFAPKSLHSPRSQSFYEAASPKSGGFEDGSNRRLSGGSSSNDMFDCASSGYGSPGIVGTPLASPAPNSLQYISTQLQKMFIDQGFCDDMNQAQNLLNNLNGLHGKNGLNGFEGLAKEPNGLLSNGLANGANGFEANLLKNLEATLGPHSPLGMNGVQPPVGVDGMQILTSIPPPSLGVSPTSLPLNGATPENTLEKMFAARPMETRRSSESSNATPKPTLRTQASITPTLPMQILSPEATPKATSPLTIPKPPPAVNDGFEQDEIQEFASLLCSPKKAPPPRYQCHICYQTGHYISDCPMRFNSPYEELTPYQGRKKCYGEFQCQQCKRKWTSQNSVANEAQSCIKCHVPVFPHKQLPIDKAVALGLVKAQRAIPTKIAPIGHGRPPFAAKP